MTPRQLYRALWEAQGSRDALAAFKRARGKVTTRRRFVGEANQLCADGATFRRVTLDVEGDRNTIVIGAGARLTNVTIQVHGSDNRLVIGERVAFKRAAQLVFEGDGGELAIGADTTIEQAMLYVEGRTALRIGADSMLAYEIEVRTGDGHSMLDAASGARTNPPRDVIMGDHVWIGARALVLKGAHIGEHSVVASHAVVTKSCEAGSVLAGNPARLIRSGVSWNRHRL